MKERVMDRYQRLMIIHGLLVIAVAMLAGFMLIFNLIGGFELWPGKIIKFDVYGTEAGWVRAHSGGIMNGILVIVIALTLPKLKLGAQSFAWLAWGFIYIAWSFTLFYWIGNASNNRSLTVGGNRLGEADWLSIIGILPGLPSVVLVLILLFIGVKGALASKGED